MRIVRCFVAVAVSAVATLALVACGDQSEDQPNVERVDAIVSTMEIDHDGKIAKSETVVITKPSVRISVKIVNHDNTPLSTGPMQDMAIQLLKLDPAKGNVEMGRFFLTLKGDMQEVNGLGIYDAVTPGTYRLVLEDPLHKPGLHQDTGATITVELFKPSTAPSITPRPVAK